MDKWPGGQNGGNHCCRTEYKKMKGRQPKRPLAQHYMHTHYRGHRKKKEKGPERVFEVIIAEKFPNMEKEIVNQ